MTDPMFNTRPLVLCPLEFERQMLIKAQLEDVCDLECCGPGADSICAWACKNENPGRPLILAGLAGALTGEHAAGSAHIITEVVDEHGEERWIPPLQDRQTADALGQTIVTSTSATLSGRLAKQIMRRDSGGTLIDLESVAFATAAEKYGWTWGIVRGISDDLSSLLPENIEQWVDDTGRTRWSLVMRTLLCRPNLIPVVLELRTNSTQAMEHVGQLVRSLVKSAASA